MRFRNPNKRDEDSAGNLEAILAEYYICFFNLPSTLSSKVATRGIRNGQGSWSSSSWKLMMVVLITRSCCPLEVNFPLLVQAKIL